MTTKFLDEKIVEQVKEFFKELDHPIKFLFFGSEEQNCEYCADTLALLEEISELDGKISMESFDITENKELAENYSVKYTPTTIILSTKDSNEQDFGVRFVGIPAGHEFSSLINSMVLVSKQESNLAAETKEKLAKLTHPLDLKVFVTPTCPYCPRAVILAHQMAIESKYITAEMVEATEFPDLSNQFNVSGVPHTVINLGDGEVIGAVPENILLDEIERAISVQAI